MDLSEALGYCYHGHAIRRPNWPSDHLVLPSRIQPVGAFRVICFPTGTQYTDADREADDWELAGCIQ